MPSDVGFVALNLAPHFKSVQGIDPAAKMVAIGLQPEDTSLPRIKYSVGSAERLDLGSGEDGVDLVVAGNPCLYKQCTPLI